MKDRHFFSDFWGSMSQVPYVFPFHFSCIWCNKLSFLGKLLASIQLWRLQKPIETSWVSLTGRSLGSTVVWLLVRTMVHGYHGAHRSKKSNLSSRGRCGWSDRCRWQAHSLLCWRSAKMSVEKHWDGRYWNSVGNIDPMGILGNKRCVFTVEKAAPSFWKHVWNWKHYGRQFPLHQSMPGTSWLGHAYIILNHGSYGSIYFHLRTRTCAHSKGIYW